MTTLAIVPRATRRAPSSRGSSSTFACSTTSAGGPLGPWLTSVARSSPFSSSRSMATCAATGGRTSPTAAPAERGRALFDALCGSLRGTGVRTGSGRFGAHMRIAMDVDGHVTIVSSTDASPEGETRERVGSLRGELERQPCGLSSQMRRFVTFNSVSLRFEGEVPGNVQSFSRPTCRARASRRASATPRVWPTARRLASVPRALATCHPSERCRQ